MLNELLIVVAVAVAVAVVMINNIGLLVVCSIALFVCFSRMPSTLI